MPNSSNCRLLAGWALEFLKVNNEYCTDQGFVAAVERSEDFVDQNIERGRQGETNTEALQLDVEDNDVT